jgi:Polysaccharide lyase
VKILNFLRTLILFGVCLITACGGDSSSSSAPASNYAVFPTPAGTACTSNFSNVDAFGNVTFEISGTGNGTAKPYSCLLVDKANNQPVYSGSQSVRFETRPGDCFISVGGYNDCANDRQHNDLMAAGNHQSTQGKIITYEYYIYLPVQTLIRPASAKGCYSTVGMIVTQLNWINTAGTDYGYIAYLNVGETGDLYLQTINGVSNQYGSAVPLDSNPSNKWIKMRYEIKSSSSADGYLNVYMNDKLVFNRTGATIPGSNYYNMLKVGIYNGQISCAAQPWQPQAIYYDGFSTSVQ